MVSIITRNFPSKYHVETSQTIIEPDMNRVYGNPRLINLSYNGALDNYTPSGGALALLRRISFQDGNTVISVLDNVHEMAKFFNLLSNDNASQVSIKNTLYKTALGYDHEFDVKYERALTESKFATDQKGYLELSHLLDFFKRYPTWQFKNPRIVLEWNTDFNYTTSAPRTGGMSIPSPSLLIDEIVTDKIKPPSSYVFMDLERDRITIPATTTANLTTTRSRMNGFNKKRCGRAVIQVISSTVNNQDGAINSTAFNNEQLQIYLDNKPILPEKETLRTKQHKVNAIWGDMNILYPQYQLPLSYDHSADANDKNDCLISAGFGQEMDSISSYGAVDFSQEMFSEFEIEYSRQRPAATDLPVSTLAVTTEVWKTCSKDGDGDAVVGYVTA